MKYRGESDPCSRPSADRAKTRCRTSKTKILISLMIFNRDKLAGMLHITSTDSEMLSRPRDMKPMWAEFRARPPFIIAGARCCCVAYTRSSSRKTALTRTDPLALVMHAQMYALQLL